MPVPLTAAQLAWLKSEVGTMADDADLQARFDRLESVRDVAIEVLRERRTKLIESPLSVNVSGVASVNYSENVAAIERRITALVKMDDDPSDDPGDGGPGAGGARVDVVQLTRSRGR